MAHHVLIVGGGHGGVQLCASLRQNGFDGDITMVSQEDCLPYHRPPLSKAFLKDISVDTQIIRPQAFFDENNIRLLLTKTVTKLNRHKRYVELADQSRIEYSKLVLSIGVKARKLDLPGADVPGVHYLRVASEAVSLREELAQAHNIVVIGGGFIGLEAASTFNQLGKKVTVFEAAERLLGRAVSAEISAYFYDRHLANGMEIQLNANVEEILSTDGRVSGVLCDGRIVKADIVLVGIGVVANCELAEQAGIDCNNGISVDAHMQTSDPDILAIGDCTSFVHWQTKQRIRLESVQNANDQAKNAALTLVGKPEQYSDVPWFWSDQGPDKLQIAGISNTCDKRVVHRNLTKNSLSVFHFKGLQLMALDTVNNPGEHMACRKLLNGDRTPTLEETRQPDFDLRVFLRTISRRSAT